MGVLLSFSPRAHSAISPSKADGRGAEIVIFPGIRYERIVDDEPDASAAHGRKKVTVRKKAARR